MKIESTWKLSHLWIAVVLAACGNGGDGTDGMADSPPASVQQQTEPGSVSSTGDEYVDYRLTMPAIRRWYEAQTSIYRAMGANPDLVDAIDKFTEANSVAELESHFAGIPEVRNAVSAAGLDMREYASILLTLYHVRGVDAAIQGGADRAQVIADQRVNEANLELVEQNRSELNGLDEQLEELGESMQ